MRRLHTRWIFHEINTENSSNCFARAKKLKHHYVGKDSALASNVLKPKLVRSLGSNTM